MLFVITTVVFAVAFLLSLVLLAVHKRKSKHSHHIYLDILNAIPYPISVTDNNRKWIFVNEQAAKMLGKPAYELIGKQSGDWRAQIARAVGSGTECLRNGSDVTLFANGFQSMQVDSTYLFGAHGEVFGSVEIVQDSVEACTQSNAKQRELVQSVRTSIDRFVQTASAVAGNATSLAQGATMQASSIDQLSTTINSIAQQIKDNSVNVKNVNDLIVQTDDAARACNSQMQSMVSAMTEISDSSNKIGNIIKDIDNIAFQTNILALNAAVEAARAGAAGKGFAVVADEVRNLAQKSAEAAQNTTLLIESSINAVTNGAAIANQTAEALEGIVSNIARITDAAQKIAEASNEQASSVEQVNTGVEQIASVVQSNTRTAQESASTSDDLVRQTRLLESSLDQY